MGMTPQEIEGYMDVYEELTNPEKRITYRVEP